MFKKILLVILILMMLAVIAFIILMGGGAKFLQGALYNLRPVYNECRIEGKDFQSSDATDCEEFMQRLENKAFPDGEYTVFAKYADSRLPENIIPLRVSENGNTIECTYLENGYEPKISVAPLSDTLSTQQLGDTQETPIYEQGTVVTVNFRKNGKEYLYDTNICEKSLQATIYDRNKQELGKASLDRNGFINSRPLVHELLINNTPYYTSSEGQTVKDFRAGNIYTVFNFAPDLFFKLTIPCSREKVGVFIPALETNKDILIPFDGLEKDYLETCGSRLYLSLQNTNQADDIQIIDQLNIDPQSDKPTYLLKLDQLARVTDKDTTFPVSFKISLHLRDRSDSTEIITLGSSLLNITGYKAGQSTATPSASGATSDKMASPDVTRIIEDKTSTTDQTAQTSRPKVRR